MTIPVIITAISCLWIGGAFGFVVAALCFAAKRADQEVEAEIHAICDDLETMIRRGG